MQYKTVSLFTVKNEFVDVPVDQHYLAEHRRLYPAPFIASNPHASEAQAVSDAVRMEILHYQKQPGTVWPFLREPKLRSCDQLAIAVEPELARLIRMPIQSELKLAEGRLGEAMEAYHKTGLELAALERQIEHWWSQPWYRRVWAALRG